MGDEVLENTYSFVYLGAEIPGDGDQKVTLKHRSDIGWARFNEHRTVLTSTKLAVQLRVRLYAALVASTSIYGSCAWLLDDNMKRSLNGMNSKMLSQVTKRTIHQEASQPTFDISAQVMRRRKAYLGHILRMDPERMVRRFVLELNPPTAPFVPGSLLADTEYQSVREMIEAAEDRALWSMN